LWVFNDSHGSIGNEGFGKVRDILVSFF